MPSFVGNYLINVIAVRIDHIITTVVAVVGSPKNRVESTGVPFLAFQSIMLIS